MSYWYAVQAKPRKESAVLSAFQRVGLEGYCPRVHQRKRRAGKKVSKESPLFPGYVFVRLQFLRDYPKIRWTPGMVRVVTSGGEPAQISEELLAEIRRIERAGTGLRLLHASRIMPGSRVRIVGGPFAGFEGQVAAHLSGGERIRILLELFRRQAALDCDPELLRPIAAAGGRP